MGSENQEKFQLQYQAGKKAFERGQYRVSVQRFEEASKLIRFQTRLGGEVGIWLVTAYQAANQQQKAVELCQKLARHPHPETKKQAKRLLYIIQAPALKRPKEWMSEIPDLSALQESDPQYQRGSSTTKKQSSQQRRKTEPEPLDLTEVNTKDNQFIWIALLATIVILGGLWWLS